MKDLPPARPPKEHAGSRYGCVALDLIDALQQEYLAGRDPGRIVPDMDPIKTATIVAESLEADHLIDTFPQRLQPGEEAPPPERVGDWSKATLAELFFQVADLAKEQGDHENQIDWRALAWASLEEVCTSPTASPMLWYEDVFYDVGQELRIRREPEALDFFKRALAHNTHHNAGDNVVSHLRNLAEAYLWLNDLDQGLAILGALLRNDPSDVWTYNLMAITFHRFGLTELGAAAARRGLELVEANGDPEGLREQLLESVERLQQSENQGRETEVDPAVLADLDAALRLDFDAGEGRPSLALCQELVPDLDRVPVKRPLTKRAPPPPGKGAQRSQTPPARLKLGRNDPCWCGSGKKYKHCHLRSDRGRVTG